jgi:glucokinase-like ROK family protein
MQNQVVVPDTFYDPVFVQNGNTEKLSNLGKKKYFQKKNIINYLYSKGNLSNPEICKLANMSSPSIHKLLNELIEDGVVQEAGIGHSIGGRRPNIFGLKPNARFVIGINIVQNFSEVAVFNLHNEIQQDVKVLHVQLENTPAFVDGIYAFCLSLLKELKIDEEKILGIGIGISGLTNPATGKSYSWLNYSSKTVKQLFEERFGKPVFVDNDARVMALGEYEFGSARNKNNVLCLNIGAGIGMGMILNGMVYHGNSGFAGEFGHIKVKDEGDLCICGKRGCLETVASGDALVKRAIEEIGTGMSSKISDSVKGNLSMITSNTAVDAARQGDQLAIDLLAEIGEYLGKGLATLIHIFNPEAIILGGNLARAEQFIIDPIQQTLNKCTIYNIKKDTAIISSALREKAAVMGAMALVMNNVFEDVRNHQQV